MSLAGVTGAGSCTGTNDVGEDLSSGLRKSWGALLSAELTGGTSASRTQRRSKFALIPSDIATDAIETPGCAADATALALNSSLCSRRRRRSPEA
jgi:hypothetical protein